MRSDLLSADEVFLSSTSAEVLPVISVDNLKIGGGRPGPLAPRIYDRFIELFAPA
jgi:branched-subunit amino acid aminotransferase/4-amino-4-deoxychorismate lyase